MIKDIRVFITGHRGYIGASLYCMLNTIPSFSAVQGYDLVGGDDILDKTNLTTSMVNFKPNIVIHLAALSSVSACNEDILQAIRENAIGTLNVLEAMKVAGCKNIIYASTSSVYGDSPAVPYDEESPAYPCSVYGYSKLLGEHVIWSHDDCNYLIYRMFNVIGKSGYNDIDAMSHPGYDRLFSALKSGEVTVYGDDYNTSDGTCNRDYVALKDVLVAYVNGILTLMGSTIPIKEVINICSGKMWSVESIIRLWDEVLRISDNSSEMINKTYGPRREGDPPSVYGTNTKALKVINWKPIRKMENIICNLCVDK